MTDEVIKKLISLRGREDYKIRLPSRMRSDQTLRPYQCIGAVHLFSLSRFFLGDAPGLGKTPQAITAYAHWLDKVPEMKLIVVTTKSAVLQWGTEFKKFTNDIKCRPIAFDSFAGFSSMKDKRILNYDKWASDSTENVIIMNYSTLYGDWDYLDTIIKEKNLRFMLFLDESNAFKNTGSKLWSTVFRATRASERAIAISATPIRNRLEEAYAQFRVLLPNLFPDAAQFENLFLVKKKIRLGRKVIFKTVGYRNIDLFKKMVEPYYIGRKKSDVAKDLPEVIYKDIELSMEDDQNRLYRQASAGVLMLDEENLVEISKLTRLIYCQLISDSPNLLNVPKDFPSSKENELFRILEDELPDEKVVIYTRFRRGVERISSILTEKGIKHFKIHGGVGSAEREEVKRRFQDDDDVNIIIINDAGGEAINLHRAGYFIFYNQPWSLGTFIQLLGRVHRIGSKHKSVVVYTLMNKDTIDSYTREVLKTKLDLVERVFGEQDGLLDVSDDITKDLLLKMGLRTEDIFEELGEIQTDDLLLKEFEKKVSNW